jgi:hypothetical protein
MKMLLSEEYCIKANRILDLYERVREGQPLKSDEFVISADEKTSIQARRRKHSTLRPAPKRPMRVEHEYGRCGAWAYIAALDVHRARVFGRLTLIHGPVHASWLNQVEIYFSIVQRKVLTPNDFTGLNQLAERWLDFQYYWEATAKPFQWKFTKADLATLLAKLSAHEKPAA